MQGAMTNIHGFSSKLLTIPTRAGQHSYNLGDYQGDNIGAGTKVVALIFRYAKNPGVCSRDDRPLIDATETQKGYINVVQLDDRQTTILSKYSLFMLTREYDIFIPPCSINWDESSIEFPPNINFDGSKDLELNILFITPCQRPISSNIVFDNHFHYNATQKKTLQINVEEGKSSFKLGSNPLSNCDTIVGLSLNEFSYTTIDERAAPNLSNFLGASFLSMRVGSRILLEDIPLTELKALNPIGYPYFPIEPTLSKDFDWTNCKINVSDKSKPIENTAYLITLFYI